MHVNMCYHASITTSMRNCLISDYFEFVMLMRDQTHTNSTSSHSPFIFIAHCVRNSIRIDFSISTCRVQHSLAT